MALLVLQKQTDYSTPVIQTKECVCGFKIQYTSCVCGPRERTIICPCCGRGVRVVLADDLEKYAVVVAKGFLKNGKEK